MEICQIMNRPSRSALTSADPSAWGKPVMMDDFDKFYLAE
jgi:hypothetical protein